MWFCLLDAACVVWHCFSELCKCYSSLREVGTCTAQPELLLSGTRDDPQSEGGKISMLMYAVDELRGFVVFNFF